MSWGLDGWGGWPKEFRTFHFQVTLFITYSITESFCCKLFDINSLAWDQILMDEIQTLKKVHRMGGALTGSHSKNCTYKEIITYSEMEKSFWKRWKGYEMSHFCAITCVVCIQLAKYLMPQQNVSETLHDHWDWCSMMQKGSERIIKVQGICWEG